MTRYKYLAVHFDPTLNLATHFDKIDKKATGRINLLRRIHSSIDMYSAERIYSAMILPIFMYCSSISLGWSHNCKLAIQNLEHRGIKIIASNQTSHSIDLQIPDVDSLIKKQACSLIV